MANTYSVTIDAIEVAPSENNLNGIIKNICFWVKIISEDNLRYNFRRCIQLPEPDESNFTDIGNLDEATIKSWITNHPDYLTEYDVNYAEQFFINERQKPISTKYNFPFLPSNNQFGNYI
jgi:hypothetical protein